MRFLLIYSLVFLGLGAPDPATADGASTREAIVRAMSVKVTFPGSLHSDHPRRVKHCRRAADGCDARLAEFARYFVAAGHDAGVDPWLLAAIAFRESGYNPYAVGSAGELGLLQIHPRNRHAKNLKWHRDPKHRDRCRAEPGACQLEVVTTAASMLAEAVRSCGALEAGLAAYHCGACKSESTYAQRVLSMRRQLLELGCPSTSPIVDEVDGVPAAPACATLDDSA